MVPPSRTGCGTRRRRRRRERCGSVRVEGFQTPMRPLPDGSPGRRGERHAEPRRRRHPSPRRRRSRRGRRRAAVRSRVGGTGRRRLGPWCIHRPTVRRRAWRCYRCRSGRAVRRPGVPLARHRQRAGDRGARGVGCHLGARRPARRRRARRPARSGPHPGAAADAPRDRRCRSAAGCRLPARGDVRTFRPGDDDVAFLGVNARAFAWHPEQGRLDQAGLAAEMAQDWFDPAGFFLAVDADDTVLGFHWTKVHLDRPARAAARSARSTCWVSTREPDSWPRYAVDRHRSGTSCATGPFHRDALRRGRQRPGAGVVPQARFRGRRDRRGLPAR